MSDSSESTVLKLRIQHRFVESVEPAIDLQFGLMRPWSVLFGPSGAGKSTVLRAIAGLMKPDAGRVIFNCETLTDTAQNIFVPPHLRGIGFVGQRSVLFPHLSVLENVMFGASEEAALQMLALFQVEALRGRRVQELSGGETRRVLLARTLAAGPKLLLLDEAFAGLEIGLRETLVASLRAYLVEYPVPVLSVTHDVSEVFALDADVIVLEAGRVHDQGEARSVLSGQREQLLRVLG